MTYGLRIDRQAASYLRRLDKHNQQRIPDRLRQRNSPLRSYTKPSTDAEGGALPELVYGESCFRLKPTAAW